MNMIDKIICGDSIDIMKTIDSETIHAIISDIPYGISYEDWDVLHNNSNSALGGASNAQLEMGILFKRRGKPLNGWSEADKKIPLEYQQWCSSWASEWLRVLKPGASCFIFAGRRYAHRCIVALEDAGLTPSDIQYINAHGTSTGLGDIAESKAIEGLFGDKVKNPNLLVSSTKSMHGHLLGATGAIECIACVKAINEHLVPPTINLEHQDENVGNLDYVPLKARKADIKAALSNSFGFGGQNASIVLKAIN